MKKFILTVSVCLVLSTISFAQKDSTNKQHRSPEQRAQQMTQGYTKRLSLTEDQKSKIYNIYLEHLKKMEAVKEQKVKGERGSMKAAMEEIDTQINSILTDEQRKQLEEIKKQRQAKMEERKAKGPNKEKNKQE
jgi:periplasmic protein CpxP/Spy